MRAWVGDRLRPFDQDNTTQWVRDGVGAVPGSVRLLLDVLADGVRLTPGGRLPRALVRAVQEQRPGWYPLGRPASVEEDLLPLATLHDVLRHVRLLRLAKGVLRPTRAAADDIETVRRLRSWFAPQHFSTLVAERAVALVAAREPMPVQQIAAEVLPLMGHGWQRGGEPITPPDVEEELRRRSHQLEALDLIAKNRSLWERWAIGTLPAAGSDPACRRPLTLIGATRPPQGRAERRVSARRRGQRPAIRSASGLVVDLACGGLALHPSLRAPPTTSS